MSLKQRIADAPLAKALIPALLSAGIGVFSGSLVTEITVASELRWAEVPQTLSFYMLLVLTAAQIIFSRWVYEMDRDVMRFSETTYCLAFIRSRLLPEVAIRFGEQIRNGQGGELKRAMDEVREVLK
jgi:uncharacterized membrane protein YfcA